MQSYTICSKQRAPRARYIYQNRLYIYARTPYPSARPFVIDAHPTHRQRLHTARDHILWSEHTGGKGSGATVDDGRRRHGSAYRRRMRADVAHGAIRAARAR